MLRSKHSGWTWEGKRTPFGGGGGIISDIGNAVSDVGSAVSNAVSDVGNTIQNNVITPISNAGVSIDQAVNQLPGGWLAPAAVTAVIAAPELAPMVSDAISSGITTQAGQDAFFSALANGSSSADAINAGLAADTAASAGTASAVTQTPSASSILSQPDVAVNLGGSTGGTVGSLNASLPAAGSVGGAGGSTGILTGGTTSGLTVPTGSAIAVDPSIAAGSGADLATAGTTTTGSATGAGLSGTSGLNPALPAAGANAGAGTGLSASLAPNTVLGTGLPGGGEIGVAYQAGANGLPATDFLGNPIPASSVGLNGSTATSLFGNNSYLPNAQSLANALKKSGGTSSTGANFGNSQLANVHYQSPWLTNTPSVPIEGSRLTTTPTALKLASLLQ
jgi:hypothetical protein